MENNKLSTATVRRAKKEDLPAIVEIYNQAILRTTATFDTEEKTWEDQIPWWNSHNDRLPIFVALREGKVVGWASLSAFSDRCAYYQSAEDSLYIHEDFRGQGLGRLLLAAVITHAQTTDIHTIISRIAEDNPVSLALHEAFGFVIKGTLTEVGFKFGKYIDVHYCQWSRNLL